MTKKALKSRGEKSGSGVVYLRVGREARSGLAALAESTGKSSNELAAGALNEFLEMVKYASDIEAGIPGKYDPSDFVDFLGPRWVQRLIAMGLACPAMKLGWTWHLEEIERLRSEVREDRKEMVKS